MFGSLSKQDADYIRTLRATVGEEDFAWMIAISELIGSIQINNSSQIKLNVTRVVHRDVEDHFKNKMSYKTVFNNAGQPANKTLLIEIEWT